MQEEWQQEVSGDLIAVARLRSSAHVFFVLDGSMTGRGRQGRATGRERGWGLGRGNSRGRGHGNDSAAVPSCGIYIHHQYL